MILRRWRGERAGNDTPVVRRLEVLLLLLGLAGIALVVSIPWSVTQAPESAVAQVVTPLRTATTPPPPPPPPPDRREQLARITRNPQLDAGSALLLLTMLREPDLEVARMAAELLKRRTGQGIVVRGDAEAKEVKASIKAAARYAKAFGALLPHTDPQIRASLTDALACLGAPGQTAIGAAIQRGAAADRVDMMRRLDLHPALLRAIVPQLTVAVADPTWGVQYQACRLAGLSGSTDPALAKALVKLLHAPVPGLFPAESALKRLPGAAATAIPELRQVLTTGADPSRKAAAEVLGFTGEPARPAVPDLMRLAREDKDDEVRAACFIALGQVAQMNEALHDLLVRGVEDPAPKPCEAAIRAMGTLGRPAVPLLSWCLVHERPAVSELATWQLRDLHPDVIRGATPDLEANLLRVLDNPKAFWAALRILDQQEAAPSTLAPHVRARFADADPNQRRVALEFVAGLGTNGALLLPDVVKLEGDPDAAVRAEVPYTAASLVREDAAVLALCRRLMADKEPRVRSGTVRGLAEFASLPAEMLEELLGVAQSQSTWRGQIDPAAEDLLGAFDRGAAMEELRRLAELKTLSPIRREIAARWLAWLSRE